MAKANNNNVTNLNFSSIAKKRFTIDGDSNRVLELNTSDLGMVTRLTELYPKLDELEKEVANITSDSADTDDTVNEFGKALKDIDLKMRSIIDEIFDSNVCEVCSPHGNMFDPIDGKFRYEHIVDTLSPLYTNTITKEFDKVSKSMSAHTSKYTK